jgi:polyisoprenoid-binding protein YceI
VVILCPPGSGGKPREQEYVVGNREEFARALSKRRSNMIWKVDPNHTSIQFAVRHIMIAMVRGRFDKFTVETHIDETEMNKIHDTGTLTEDDILNSHLSVQIEAASITTGNADRDAHLRSPDFLDVEKYPFITFKARRGEKIDDTHGRLIGDLTIRDVTREFVLDGEFLGQAKTPWGTINAAFNGQTKISRKNWGLTYNVALETGGWMVGDEIKIETDIEFTQVPETATPPAEQVAA